MVQTWCFRKVFVTSQGLTYLSYPQAFQMYLKLSQTNKVACNYRSKGFCKVRPIGSFENALVLTLGAREEVEAS